MEINKNYVSKLFVYTAVDIKDDLEEKYERAYQSLQQQANGLNDKELHDLLSQLVCKDKHHEEISLGLLYTILTDATSAPKTYRDLTLLTRDGFTLVTTNLSILVAEKYTKFTEIARRQLLWLLRELVKNQVLNVDNIIWNCLRQASGGDISQRNLFLVEGLLDIFIEHRSWLEKNSFLVGAVVYTYVRLIEDHFNPILINLRNKEIKFVIGLIRDRFVDVIPLGRDFVRLLQNVARIPEFEQLWRDMLLNPKSLCPTFNGVWQLLQIRTRCRFLLCRLTPEIEKKIHFLASSVKFGNHKRYQDWFQDKYFSTPESHSLRSDLIRFIINAIHPTNDMLCSDIIPRWAIIGWLLTSCTNPVALANAKLALFYDWLFFDPQKDNIMNVEPGILVMYHSIRNHPLVSSTLLDFLCRIMKNFYPKCEDKIRAGVYNSLRKILEKQVIPNLHPLFESPKLDRELRVLIRESFREFCTSSTTTTAAATTISGRPNNSVFGGGILGQTDLLINNSIIDDRTNNLTLPTMGGLMQDESRLLSQQQHQHMPHQQHLHQQHHYSTDQNRLENDAGGGSNIITPVIDGNNENNEADSEAVFSDDDEETSNVDPKIDDDDDDDLPLAKVRLKEKPLQDRIELPATIQESFEKFLLHKTSSNFEEFLRNFRTLSVNAINDEQQNYIFNNTIIVLKQTTPSPPIFPDSKNDEKLLTESISYPIFSVFRTMYHNDDKCKKLFQQLLSTIYKNMSDFGYLCLYFLKVYTKLQTRLKNSATSSSSGGGSSQINSSSTITALSNQNIQFKGSIYKQICDTLDEKFDNCLVRDLTNLECENTQIFLWILPDIYREFKTSVTNNSEIIKIILSCVDAKNLRDLIYNITQGKLTLFKNDGLINCVRNSLRYETFEQFCLWQLVQAHDVPIEYLQDLLPELESSNHAEALTSMLFLLKNEKPTTELIRLLLSRDTKSRGDPFVTSALRYWCQDSEEVLSEIIANLLTSKYLNISPNKRKRPLKSNSNVNSTPSSDQLLSHLEHFRRSCRHGNGTGTGLYVQDAMQRALQQAFSHSSDSTKKLYSDLFALAAEDDTTGVGRRGGSSRGRKQPNSKKDTNSSHATSNKKNFEAINNVYTSDEESSDEDWSKRKLSKRRKKALSESDD